MRKAAVFLLLVMCLLSLSAAGAQEAGRATPVDPSAVQFVEVASGFNRPLYVTGAGDGSGRLFVVEQLGRIWIVQDGQRLQTPFLDISAKVTTRGNEQGLLGLAFHPNYAENGYFYVNYSDLPTGDTIVARYNVSADDPNLADQQSEYILLTQEQPYQNHNGGHMVFGPDDYLYIGLGDGGSQGDPQDNAQNLGSLLGKILRIDVDGGDPYAIPADNPFAANPNAAPEIWSYGLRNPWRFTFDRATGDMYIGDVGQNAVEEINFEPADSPGGVNYGWNFYEGSQPYSGQPAPADVVMPVAEYGHNMGISVTGGYVYRGSLIPDLQGVYLYADFGSGWMWYAYRDDAGVWHNDVFKQGTGQAISSFGEDEDGELYFTSFNGGIWRFELVG